MNQQDYSEAPTANTATRRAAAEIRGLMAARHLNAVDLGPVLQLSRTAATRRFNGDADFTINELELIAGFLDVPITRIIAPAPGHPFST